MVDTEICRELRIETCVDQPKGPRGVRATQQSTVFLRNVCAVQMQIVPIVDEFLSIELVSSFFEEKLMVIIKSWTINRSDMGQPLMAVTPSALLLPIEIVEHR